MSLEEVIKKYDLNQREFSRRIANSPAWLSASFYSGYASKRKISKTAKLLHTLGEVLLGYNPKEHDLLKILRATGLKISWLAQQLNMSRQGLHNLALEDRIPAKREREIRSILHQVGHQLISSAKELSH